MADRSLQQQVLDELAEHEIAIRRREATAIQHASRLRELEARPQPTPAVLGAAIVAAVATIAGTAMTVWVQHTAERANAAADARWSAQLERRLIEVKTQLNHQSAALQDLRDDWRRGRREIDQKIAASPMALARESRPK